MSSVSVLRNSWLTRYPGEQYDSFLLNARHLRAGGLLSKDSPFLDIILEGVKLRLPSAEVAYPRVEPALGAALLAHDACFGATDSIGEASSSPFASPPRFLSRHETLPQSHGEWKHFPSCVDHKHKDRDQHDARHAPDIWPPSNTMPGPLRYLSRHKALPRSHVGECNVFNSHCVNQD